MRRREREMGAFEVKMLEEGLGRVEKFGLGEGERGFCGMKKS